MRQKEFSRCVRLEGREIRARGRADRRKGSTGTAVDVDTDVDTDDNVDDGDDVGDDE